MSRKKGIDEVRDRVAHYRTRNGRQGMQRVETTVAADDARLIRDIAKVLREGGSAAEELRRAIGSLVPPPRAESGEDLLAFFRRSPFTDEEAEALPVERDRSDGRDTDLRS